MDGASAWQRFRYVTLPLLKPTILLTSVLTMLSAFQVFDLFQVMTDGGPGNGQTRVLTLDIYENAFRYQRMGWAAAVSLVLFLHRVPRSRGCRRGCCGWSGSTDGDRASGATQRGASRAGAGRSVHGARSWPASWRAIPFVWMILASFKPAR